MCIPETGVITTPAQEQMISGDIPGAMYQFILSTEPADRAGQALTITGLTYTRQPEAAELGRLQVREK